MDRARTAPEGDAPRDATESITVLTREDALGIGMGDDVLVVDDSATNLIAMESALAPLGRKIATARSGIEALAQLLEQDFSLIILDMAMPEMSGIETARMIRARERSRGTPIIFVTGMTWDEKVVDEAYEVGAFEFLVKPVRAEVLRAKARVFLQLQERTRALYQHAQALRESQALLHEQAIQDQLARQLAEAQRGRHEFVEIMNHELRNPLQTLQIACEMLIHHPGAETSERLAPLVKRHFRHVTRIVDDLLDVTRLSTGTIQLSREDVDLIELIRHAIADCELALGEHSVHFDIVEDVLPVYADPVRLLQVFSTLVDNAAKHTDVGGRIDISVTVDADTPVIRISDNGRGVSSDLLPRIFEAFVHERTRADGFGALGLGLALVKRLVELHDGTVTATSEGPGKGSTFEVRIPRRLMK